MSNEKKELLDVLFEKHFPNHNYPTYQRSPFFNMAKEYYREKTKEDQQNYTIPLSVVGCNNCHSSGMITDLSITSGEKICPKCHGAKYFYVPIQPSLDAISQQTAQLRQQVEESQDEEIGKILDRYKNGNYTRDYSIHQIQKLNNVL